jgi:hypothetical protein
LFICSDCITHHFLDSDRPLQTPPYESSRCWDRINLSGKFSIIQRKQSMNSSSSLNPWSQWLREYALHESRLGKKNLEHSGGRESPLFSAGSMLNKQLFTKTKSAIELLIELSTSINTHHHVGNNSTSPLRM